MRAPSSTRTNNGNKNERNLRSLSLLAGKLLAQAEAAAVWEEVWAVPGLHVNHSPSAFP